MLETIQLLCYYINIRFVKLNIRFVVISECNTHDTFHLFQRLLINLLQNKSGQLRKHLWMCCPVQEFKNVISMSYHEEYSAIEAEWHFFATSVWWNRRRSQAPSCPNWSVKTSQWSDTVFKKFVPNRYNQYYVHKLAFATHDDQASEKLALNERFYHGEADHRDAEIAFHRYLI